VSRRLLANAVAIGLATAVYGFSFGALAVTAGLSTLQTVAMSAFVFTGATQLAVVGVLLAGGALPGAIANGLLLALRHLAYGVAVAPILPRRLAGRLLAAQLIVDESTAMATAQRDESAARHAFWATGVSVFVCWNAATVAGALASRALADPNALGLDAVFPAAFVALLAPQLRRPGAPVAALAGVLLAAVLVPIAPPGVPVLVAAAGVAAGLRRARA
jgi:predicted branched-subunit amino acid permease